MGASRFTHLAAEKNAKAILRNGIKPSQVGQRTGVYAMPVLPNFFASHQWLRELRRGRSSPLIAVDFLIDDDESVYVGHYSEAHTTLTAVEASGLIMHADDPRGFEVLIPRKIEPEEIKGTRPVPQVVGWRYWPDAHGTRPCTCEVCQRGDFKSAAIRNG